MPRNDTDDQDESDLRENELGAIRSIFRSVLGHRILHHARPDGFLHARREQFVDDTRDRVTAALSSVAVAYSNAVDAVVATGVDEGEARDRIGARLEAGLFRMLTETP